MKKQIFTKTYLTNIKTFNFLANISFPQKDEKLKKSLYENGVLSPLLVVKKNKNYFLVDGHKRFLLLKEKNLNQIPLFVENYLSEKLVFIKFFKINLYRGFNFIEFSNILNITENYFNDRILSQYIFTRLEKKYSTKVLKNFLNLKNLAEDGKILLINEKLNINLSFQLSKLKTEDQIYFIKLITSLKLNSNKQKRAFEMIFDLSKRENSRFKNIIEKYFKNFISVEYTKDLEEKFFKKLISIHSPEFFNYNEKFKKLKKETLKNEKGINIYSPSNFEDNILKAEIYFKNQEDLRKKLKKLEKFNFPKL